MAFPQPPLLKSAPPRILKVLGQNQISKSQFSGDPQIQAPIDPPSLSQVSGDEEPCDGKAQSCAEADPYLARSMIVEIRPGSSYG